jgi:hypothetical protein
MALHTFSYQTSEVALCHERNTHETWLRETDWLFLTDWFGWRYGKVYIASSINVYWLFLTDWFGWRYGKVCIASSINVLFFLSILRNGNGKVMEKSVMHEIYPGNAKGINVLALESNPSTRSASERRCVDLRRG